MLALSDGVFAIAATLLALDLRVPEDLDSARLHRALYELVPSMSGYAITFIVIGVLWLGHHELFGVLQGITARIAVANVVLLGFVALLPFPSSMLADYGQEPIVVIIYACNVAVIALTQLVIVAIAVAERGLWEGVSIRSAVAPSAVTFIVFVISVPFAMVIPVWAPAIWLLLIPAHLAVDRLDPISE